MAATTTTDGGQSSLSLEQQRLTQEGELRLAELALRAREIAVKEAEVAKSHWLNPTSLGLFAAAVGLIGNLVVAWLNNRTSQALAHNQAQSTLIVQAVSTGNADTACKNIVSFIELGLIDDPKGTLKNCVLRPSSIPVLPSAKSSYVPEADSAYHMNVHVDRTDDGDKWKYKVTFTVPPYQADVDSYSQITVYAFRMDKQNLRLDDINLPETEGTWKPGDTATFYAELDKSFVEKAGLTPHLHFCIGAKSKGCFPSENVLIPAALDHRH